MKTNPGGQIDPDAVVGRDHLIQTLWDSLARQSLIITAERRIGKTTVMKMMAHRPQAGWHPVYQDLESCHSAQDFALAVYRVVGRFLGTAKKLTRKTTEILNKYGGTEIGGVVTLPKATIAPWKDVLTAAIEDLIHENSDGTTRLLFLWDELPFMLMNIRDGEGEAVAMQVLDHLRWLRQTHPALRMVITGSIGLHHVITALKDHRYGNAPLNDLLAIDVPPLGEKDAAHLAAQLIAGERLSAPDLPTAAVAIAREADCFPFYIHHIVRGLVSQAQEATPENARAIVQAHLVDPNDPWQLVHYRERIRTYYPDDQQTVPLILDQVAVEPGSSVNRVLAVLKGASSFDDRERLQRLLSLLARDHYLRRDGEGHYHFRFPLIRRWWKLDRGV